MPKKSTQSPSGSSFFPPNDPATYRDLLLFEERLKTNALILNRRKSRYQCMSYLHLPFSELFLHITSRLVFLVQLIFAIIFLLCEVLLHTPFLSVPYQYLLRRAFPNIYGSDVEVRLHPYVASGLLFVSVTTLLLFFATGLYSEKIGYANRCGHWHFFCTLKFTLRSYVPHANRALRSFNMYLNMRQAPHRSLYNPLSYLFPRPFSPHDRSTTPNRARSPSPTQLGRRSSSAVPMPSIPPTTNPRGELIFSSRVDRSFREAYERYRAAFERKRDERERQAAASTWTGWLLQKLPWNRAPTPTADSSTSTPSQSRVGSALRGRIGAQSSNASLAPSRRSTPAQSSEPGRGRPGVSSVGV
jgi:Spo7-like protein